MGTHVLDMSVDTFLERKDSLRERGSVRESYTLLFAQYIYIVDIIYPPR